MHLICVRHGRTAWNAAARFQGSSDIPLDEVGRAQARALAKRLASERFDLALSSDLKRAFDTAKAIGRASSAVIQLEPRLREMHFGTWEGLTWHEISQREQALATTLAEWEPPGGETFTQVCRRIEPVLEKLAAFYKASDRVLVVSHAAVIHAIVALTAGRSYPLPRFHLTLGATVRLSHAEQGWRVVGIESLGVDQ